MYTRNRIPVGRKSIEVKTDKNTPDNFLGIGKKAKAKKAVRVAQRQEKKAVKIDMKKARVADKLSKAESRIELAKQGIQQQTGLQAVGGAIGGLLGAGNRGGDSSEGMGDVTPVAATLPTIVNPAQLAPSQIGITPPVEGTGSNNEQPEYEQPARQRMADSTGANDKKDNTMLYVIISVAVVVLFFFFRKN